MRVFVVGSSPQFLKPDLYEPQPDDLVVAADGGANLCTWWHWPVDAVVGDMDSIFADVRAQLEARGVPFHISPVEKDETDLELALSLALARGASEIIIAGTLGARVDHTLGALALLVTLQEAGVPARIVDGSQTVWLVKDRLSVFGEVHDLLSLLPYGGDAQGVSVTGVYWPLNDADLPLGPSLAISNKMTARRADISVQAGQLIAVHIRT